MSAHGVDGEHSARFGQNKYGNKGAAELRPSVAASARGTELAAEQLAAARARLLAMIKSELCGKRKNDTNLKNKIKKT